MNFFRLKNPGSGWGPLSLTRSGLRRFEAALRHFFARRASSNNRNIKSKKLSQIGWLVWASAFWCYLPGYRGWASQFARAKGPPPVQTVLSTTASGNSCSGGGASTAIARMCARALGLEQSYHDTIDRRTDSGCAVRSWAELL